MEDLKERIGIENEKPIPADYNIPYFVHQDDMNKLDMSHKRIEKWLLILTIIIFVALVGTNGAWLFYENSFQDVVVTENTQDGEGINIMSGGGDVSYGAEVENSKDQSKEEW